MIRRYQSFLICFRTFDLNSFVVASHANSNHFNLTIVGQYAIAAPRWLPRDLL